MFTPHNKKKISHITATMVEQILVIVSKCADKDRISSFIIGFSFHVDERHCLYIHVAHPIYGMKNNECLKSFCCTFIVIVIFEYIYLCMVSSLLSMNVMRIKLVQEFVRKFHLSLFYYIV